MHYLLASAAPEDSRIAFYTTCLCCPALQADTALLLAAAGERHGCDGLLRRSQLCLCGNGQLCSNTDAKGLDSGQMCTVPGPPAAMPVPVLQNSSKSPSADKSFLGGQISGVEIHTVLHQVLASDDAKQVVPLVHHPEVPQRQAQERAPHLDCRRL